MSASPAQIPAPSFRAAVPSPFRPRYGAGGQPLHRQDAAWSWQAPCAEHHPVLVRSQPFRYSGNLLHVDSTFLNIFHRCVLHIFLGVHLYILAKLDCFVNRWFSWEQIQSSANCLFSSRLSLGMCFHKGFTHLLVSTLVVIKPSFGPL